MKHAIVSLIFGLLLAALYFFTSGLDFWILSGISALFYLSIVGIGSGFIWSQYHLKAYLGNSSATEKVIALSFDDGPSEFTLEILELLQQYQAKATFFCIGKQLEKHPEIAQKVVDQGHILANHSYSHSKYFDFYSADKIYQELIQTDRLIEGIVKKKPNYFRPPYGVTTPSIANAVRKTKHSVIGWSLRSNDGISSDVNAIFQRIEKGLKPGKIVLMHDTSKSSVMVLERLLLLLERENYKVISIEELLQIPAYEK